MSNISFALKALWRDGKSGELRLIGIAIVIAVACLTSVNFFTDRVKRATTQQATELLAADLVLISSAPIHKRYVDLAVNNKLDYSHNESFRSVVVKDERLELAEIKAVDDIYPIRGKLKVSDKLFSEEHTTDSIPASGAVWIDSRLMQALQVSLGETISLGASQFIVDKILTYEPDRGGDLFNIAPRLLMNRMDLGKTELVLPGSRVQYRLLLGGNSEDIEQFRSQLKISENENIRIQGIKDARPEIRTALERAQQFLGLAALVSIALAGLAIAMSAQRYASRHYDTCAILRCLGLQQRQIIHAFLLQLIILTVFCSLLGCLIGYFAQEVLNQLMIGFSQTSLPKPSLMPVISGLLAGLITVLAFALPQLMRLAKVSPLRVLRRDLNPVPINDYLIYLIAVIGLVLLSPWQSGNGQLTLYTLLGLLVTALTLATVSRIVIRVLRKFLPGIKIEARYGLANLTRRANQSTLQIIGIGIGITVILLLTLVRTDLLDAWQNRLPEKTPNYFLINIQPDQVESIKAYLYNELNEVVALYPMIRGRLVKINDEPVVLENYKDPRARRLAAREFNLSYAEHMQPDNRLVAGSWWDNNEPDKKVFSVEQGIADTLGIQMGDRLTYLIAGQELDAEVSNLRWVEWDSFNVNFFVVANPKALQESPSTFISSFYLPDSKRLLLNKLLKQFPSITVFDVDAILKQVRTIMEQVVRTVEFVFIFTLLAGLTVLFAALQATHDERTHEAALMSALGANRKQIVSGLVAEFLILGLITGLLSAISASLIELALAEFLLKMDITINPLIWLVAPVCCCMIIIFTGLLGTRKVLTTAPTVVLRQV